MKQRSNILGVSALAIVISLSACGGGGGDGDTEMNSTPPAPVNLDPGFFTDAKTGKVVLYSAKENLQKYLGKWDSGCSRAEAQFFSGVKSLINVYQFTSVQGTTVKGKLIQFQFSDRECKLATSQSKVEMGVILNSISEEAISSNSAYFSGYVDSMVVSYTGLTYFDRPDFAAFSEGYQYMIVGRQRGLLVSNLLDGVVYTKK